EDIFFDAIDNTEALGIVNIFAAGNQGGYGASTITNPAIRALDSIDCFAVGAVRATDPENVTLYLQSSRGPSICPSGATKPNVMAPGLNVQTTIVSGYGGKHGTSLSAPQVAGLVALLRQKNPNATVSEIKTAILVSTDRSNFPGEANDSTGWGEIDCRAALDYLSADNSEPNIILYDFTAALASPGQISFGNIVLLNRGAEASSVSGLLTSDDPHVTVIQGTVTFGDISEGATFSSLEEVQLQVSGDAPLGSVIPMTLALNVSGQPEILTVSLLIGPVRERAMADHNTGRIEFSVSNFGLYGLGPASILPVQGKGFLFDGGENHLTEAGLIVGQSTTKTSSSLHSYVFASDNDFTVADNGFMRFYSDDGIADEHSMSAMIDRNSANPINLRIAQETFSYTSPDDDFVLIMLALHNETNESIDDVYTGLYLDWDIRGCCRNAGGWETDDSVAWIAYNKGTLSFPNLEDFRAMKLVAGNLSSVLTFNEEYVATPLQGGNGFTEQEKYLSLRNGVFGANDNASATQPLFQVIASGPHSIMPGQADTLAFAMMAGSTLVEIKSAASRAQVAYNQLHDQSAVDDPETGNLPSQFVLHQNYPNPFNPSTVIAFEIPVASDYRLRVYNMAGRLVDERNGFSSAGTVRIEWSGSTYATGLYFYEVTVGRVSRSGKMLLLK
ncbi:MAG: S8 family serine peptidase, partial [candidate division Zixibacteria bacterium]